MVKKTEVKKVEENVKRLNLKLPAPLHKKVKMTALANNKTLQAFICEALENAVE